MGVFTLDEDEVEAIFLALKGERNLDTLTKLKDKLELAQMHAGVREVEGMLRVLQGTGIQQPGLLRMFNPQHDALADAGNEQRHQEAVKGTRPRKKKGGAADDTAPMPFPQAESPEGQNGAEPAPADGPQWGEGTPTPRPAKGQLATWPSGESIELTDVLGYDPEAAAFRVTLANGWDGMVYGYGRAEHLTWRVATMRDQYPDKNAAEAEPLGEAPTALLEARRLAHQLEQLGSSGEISTPDLVQAFTAQAAELLRYTLWLMPATVDPDIIREGFQRAADLETPAERPRVLARTVLFNLESEYGPEEPAMDPYQAEEILAAADYPVEATAGDVIQVDGQPADDPDAARAAEGGQEIAGTARAQEIADQVREELADTGGESSTGFRELGQAQDEAAVAGEASAYAGEVAETVATEPEQLEESPESGKRGGRGGGGQRARNAAQAGVAKRGRRK